MTNFIPDTIIPDAVTIKILRIASSDCDVNGKCLNSPYDVKHHGKLYRAACWTTPPKGNSPSNLHIGEIFHIPMSDEE